MNILSVINLKKTYGVKTLFENINFNIDTDDKIGVIGINGTGKSSMLRIVAGADTPDAGEVRIYGDKRIEYLPQHPDFDENLTVLDQVFRANTPEMRLVRDYERTLEQLSQHSEDHGLQQHLFDLTNRIDALGLWQLKSQVETILTQLGIKDFDKPICSLSGGQRKRVAMASVLLAPCDLLILDEPTNHLDNATTAWLEEFLKTRKGALLMVTHDRYFLDRVVNRTIELDSGKLYEYTGNYSQFVELKAARKAYENAMEQKRQNLYRRELAWIRRGARARTTKQKARIDRFNAIKNSAVNLEEASLNINVSFTRLGKQVIDIDHLSKSFKNQPIITDFSYTFGQGERVGIIGQNGRGKSTLLNIIAGRLKPDSGHVAVGDTVKIGYFSQEAAEMDLNLRAIEYIREGAETAITAEGEIITAAQMMEFFLFDRYAQWVRISELSGGERRRLYLLRVLMEAPNVLLLDEPTNDLDIDTLQVLENYLDDFQGTVLTVSHDRYFLDRICHTIFSFTGNGHIRVQTGNFTDYINKHPLSEHEPVTSKALSNVKSTRSMQRPRRLNYHEQQEYKILPDEIAALEEKLDAIEIEIFGIATDYLRLQELTEKREQLEETLLEKMEKQERYDAILKESGQKI